jgi:hypothetical protein
MRMGKRLFFAVALCILSAAGVRAQTINAASCNSSDVQTALNKVSQSSATVIIPAGTCTWTSGIAFTVPSGTTSLTVQGAGAQFAATGGSSTVGTDSTVITDNVTHNPSNQATLGFVTTSGQSVRITGMAILQNSSSVPGYVGVVHFAGSSTAIRIDHCHFYGTVGTAFVWLSGTITGVADHDFFEAAPSLLFFFFEFQNGSNWNGATDGLGDGSFADTSHWGTSQFFFAEDDYFHHGTYVDDCEDGGRFVIRHSTIVDAALTQHGTAGSPGRGCRAVEVYDSTFTYPDNANGYSNVAIGVNSGTALVWGNTVSNNQVVVQTDDRRDDDTSYGESAPPNAWGYCGSALTGVTSSWDGNVTSNGYPCLDMPARGKGDLITGATFPNIVNSVLGGQTWPREALDPIYIWANTYNQVASGRLITDASGKLTDNQDYYQQFGTYGEPGSWNGTKGINQSSAAPSGNCTAGTDPKTGGAAPGVGWWNTSNNTLYVCTATNTWTAYYTPYTYPHPLTQGAGTVAPNAPTNLEATVQ